MGTIIDPEEFRRSREQRRLDDSVQRPENPLEGNLADYQGDPNQLVEQLKREGYTKQPPPRTQYHSRSTLSDKISHLSASITPTTLLVVGTVTTLTAYAIYHWVTN
tara:strand:- start:26254 stop:26571 length:318 start_codon:yes stop_codon:yes gene_type:complete